jgi:hypothetical protein
MKTLRIIRAVAITGVVALSIFGMSWRASLSDKGVAAYQNSVKNAPISISVEEEGRIITVEPTSTPGQSIRPCKATLIFDVK